MNEKLLKRVRNAWVYTTMDWDEDNIKTFKQLLKDIERELIK